MKKKEKLALVEALMAPVNPFTDGIGAYSRGAPSEYEKSVISAFLKLCKEANYTPNNDWEHNIIADCYAALRNN
jgi:hypothetical protein